MSAPITTESALLAHSSLFVSLQAATLRSWGDEGLAESLRYLSRGALNRSVMICEDWLPERYALEWLVAVWHGPAQCDYASYMAWLRCLAKLHVGRVRRPLLWLAGPRRLLAHTPTLWRREHSHGHLHVDLQANAAVITLRDHPWTHAPLAYVALAELLRQALLLSRAERAEVAGLRTDSETLTITLHWHESRRLSSGQRSTWRPRQESNLRPSA